MYKDKNGLYRMQVTINGQRKVFNGRTQREVLLKIAEYQETKKGVLFKDVAKEWWRDSERRLSPTTMRGYNSAYDRAVDEFGDKFCEDITTQQVSAYISRIGLSQKSATNHLLVLRLILQWAVVHHGVEYNVAQNVKAPRGRKAERKYPTTADIEIINANTDLPFGLFVYFALWTGLRRGEICGLQWKHIDFENKTIHVRQSVYFTADNRPHIKTPKTVSGNRDVPMHDELANKLRPLKTASDDFVFGGKQPLREYQVQTAMNKYRASTGLSCGLHGLRHGFASILFQQGLDLKTVSYILGHAQTSTTLDIYVHLLQTDKISEAREKLNTFSVQ